MLNQIKQRAYRLSLTAVCIAMLAACGGGDGVEATPAPFVPTLAAVVTLDDGSPVGRATFPAGPTAIGGKGQLVQGLACVKPAKPSAAYTYAHLNLVVDGQLIAIPDNIGLGSQGNIEIADPAVRQIGCYYPMMTNDTSGKIRTQPGGSYTLGQFFALWGQPLGVSNVAGYTGKPVKVFIREGATLTQYTGALDALPLTPNREITIQVGAEQRQISAFDWINPPAPAATPLVPYFGASDPALTGQRGVLEGNRTNGKGGQGAPVDGIVCYGPKNANLSAETFHIHSHLSIFRDGVQLAVPENIGIVGNEAVPSTTCDYPLHTHDATGILHVEAPIDATFTLGQFFSIWGQPLSRTNVAGLTNLPVVVYIQDGGNLRKYQGDLASIELRSFRSVVIQMGTPLAEIPTYALAIGPQ